MKIIQKIKDWFDVWTQLTDAEAKLGIQYQMLSLSEERIRTLMVTVNKLKCMSEHEKYKRTTIDQLNCRIRSLELELEMMKEKL